MIISRVDFEREMERVSIQNNDALNVEGENNE